MLNKVKKVQVTISQKISEIEVPVHGDGLEDIVSRALRFSSDKDNDFKDGREFHLTIRGGTCIEIEACVKWNGWKWDITKPVSIFDKE